MNLLSSKILIPVFVFSTFFAFGERADAATMFIRPARVEVAAGNIVSLQVTVDTAGKVINNAESVIQFPRDLLEVVSLDNRSSIFSLWVEQPSFSNNTGQISFNGGVPNPGYQGSSGNVITVIFRAKKAGTASVILLNSAVRENDGLGTDILTGKSGAEVVIAGPQAPVPVPAPVPAPDSGFVVTSSTHSSQNAWYNKDDVTISWTLPRSATAVRTLLGAFRDSDPTVYYDSPITSKRIENLEDGTWYFHVNYFANGTWSRPLHYKLQVDTVSPTDLSVRSEKDEAGKVTLYMKSGDSLSGIDHYLVVVGSDSPLKVKSDVNGEALAEVPFYRSGEHNITVTAVDKAGNTAETELTVTNDFVMELRIDSYPAKLRINEGIEIAGSAPYPYASLRVSLRNSDNVVQTYKIKSNSYSKFNFISEPITVEGNYAVWVDILKDNGEVSLSSQEVVIAVETPLLLQIGSYTIGLMKVLIPAAALLIIFLLTMLYGWYKFFHLYHKIKAESHEAEKVVGKSFTLLRKDLANHIAKLRRAEAKRKLTTEEIAFLEQFEEELTEAEGVIEKEVRDISEA